MKVILAEKPDMGKSIASALGIANKGSGYYVTKSGDIVTWAIGHIIQNSPPEAYPEYKTWSFENLPFVPDPVLLEVDPSKKMQFDTIKKLLEQADTCVIATDPGREGEHIARLILKQAEFSGKLERLWISDKTDETIQAGFRDLRKGTDYDNLAAAAEIRSVADFWIGITATRFLTMLAGSVTNERTLLAAGRVQTPTLRIVYDRELMIEKFKPEPFYTLLVDFATGNETYQGRWFKQDGQDTINRFTEKEAAEQIKQAITGRAAQVRKYTEKEAKRSAPQLFDGASLRTAARKQLGFSIEKTSDILQKVYDKKYCSYPRTESKHLTENAAHELQEHLTKLQSVSRYASLFPEHIGSLIGNKRYVDDKKAKEHHGIIPTRKNPDDFKGTEYELTPDEEKLYELILRHTLAAFHPVGIDRETEVVTEVAGETFLTRSVFSVSPGWRSIYADAEAEEISKVESSADESQKVPRLEEGMSVQTNKGNLKSGQTTAPKRLTDTDLENAMKYAGRIVNEETLETEVYEQLKSKGIGTVATRVEVISKLQRDGYIELQKNQFHLTTKGRNFMRLVYDHPIASLELTGEFEQKLEEVAAGERDAGQLRLEFKKIASDLLQLQAVLTERMRSLETGGVLFSQVESIGFCPKCNGNVVANKFGYGCSNWRNGCTFKIGAEFRKKSLSKKGIQDLLAGKDLLLKGIKKSSGDSEYDMVLSLKDGQLTQRFPDAEDKSLGACPECGEPVIEGEKFYGCSAWKGGCQFKLFKSYLKISITPAQMKKLLKKGKTDVLKGLEGRKGPFDSALGYSKETQRYCLAK